jgi:hypothetical protein
MERAVERQCVPKPRRRGSRGSQAGGASTVSRRVPSQRAQRVGPVLWEVKVVWGTWARRSYVNGSTAGVNGVLIRPGMAGVTGRPARVGCAESCSHTGRGRREGAECVGGEDLIIK